MGSKALEVEVWKSGTGQVILVHTKASCVGQYCVVHRPSAHAMKDFPTHWRDDHKLMERICPHGIAHPDPDHINFLPVEKRRVEFIHRCDGCCADALPSFRFA